MSRQMLLACVIYICAGALAARAGAFRRLVNYRVGSTPFGIAVADFNLDGKPDLVTANYSGSSVSVMLGNGDGTFQASATYAAGIDAMSVAVADFNGDRKPDLVTANAAPFSGSVSVLLGNGDGSFQSHVDLATGMATHCVRAADFNDDGKLDLATANFGDDTASILMGNGDGTFQTHADYPTAGAGNAIVVADFSADTKLDLAIANEYGQSVTIYLGNGDGTFGSRADYWAGGDAYSVDVSDFNEDGNPDLVTASQSSTIGVLLGNGDGSFQPATILGGGGASHAPQAIVVGDFNADGKGDLVTPTDDDLLSVMLGNGEGTFKPEQSFLVDFFPNGVMVADLNGDGAQDIATSNSAEDSGANGVRGPDTVSVLLSTRGTFLASTSSANPSTFGQSVTFTTTVSASKECLSCKSKPTGTVTFKDGSVVLGSGDLVNGQATVTISALAVGNHEIQTRYSGDRNFNPHGTNAIKQQVVP